jgi:hypothetical protein
VAEDLTIEVIQQKVTGWVADYNRLLFKLVSEPEREWRQLTGVAS